MRTYSKINVQIQNNAPEITAEQGTVMTQAAAIVHRVWRRTNFRFSMRS